MNKGFSKLEIILIGIILLFTIGFLGTKNLSLFVSKENLLRQRFNKFVSLLDDKNYSEAYNFYSSSIKNKGSLEDYIKDVKESPNIGKQKVTINNIVIKDNIGYVDRNNTVCEDNNCITRKELRGYKRWVFENSNWYYSPPDPSCIRDEPYEKPPELERALSLFKQRYSDKFGKGNDDDSIFNCLDIQYAALDNTEGIFTFDKNKSSLDRLSIYVDNSYKIKDDILTAFLLSHEINHASNYLIQLNNGTEFPCYDFEISAFQTQLMFLGSLTQEEQDSLVGRIATMDYGNNNPLMMVKTFTDFSGNARYACGSYSPDCYSKKMTDQIVNMVKSNPYYQKQCGQN